MSDNDISVRFSTRSTIKPSTPSRWSLFPRPAPFVARSPRTQSPIISPDSKSKPTISRTRSFTLIPTGNTRRSENPRQADNTVVSKKQARIKFRQKTNPEKTTLPYRSHDARVVDRKLSEKKAMIAEVEVQLVFFAKRFFLVSVSRFFGSFLLRLLYRRRNRGSCLGWFQDLSRRL